MKKLILLLGLLYGCSKDNTTAPQSITSAQAGDSVNITLLVKYTKPTDSVHYQFWFSLSDSNSDRYIGGVTQQTQKTWHFYITNPNIRLGWSLCFPESYYVNPLFPDSVKYYITYTGSGGILGTTTWTNGWVGISSFEGGSNYAY